MVKYIFIDFEKSDFPYVYNPIEKIVIDKGGEVNYVCDICYRNFKTNNLNHYEKCRFEYSIEGVIPTDIGKNDKIFIFYSEKGYNKNHIESIIRMGDYSKIEQGIGFRITSRGLLGKEFYNKLVISGNPH